MTFTTKNSSFSDGKMATGTAGRQWRRQGEGKRGRKSKKQVGDDLARNTWVAKQKEQWRRPLERRPLVAK